MGTMSTTTQGTTMPGTQTFVLDATRQPIMECPATVQAITSDATGDRSTLCSWCGRLAEYKITHVGDDWQEIACQDHRERYWATPVSLTKYPLGSWARICAETPVPEWELNRRLQERALTRANRPLIRSAQR